jgi:Domain of unknown function (DUF2427)
MSRLTHLLLLPFLLTLYAVRAHEGHDELSEEEATAAVDSILWIHIFLQASVWGILFPIGMVFGLSRSRWHVPLQVRPSRPRPSTSHFPRPTHPFFVSSTGNWHLTTTTTAGVILRAFASLRP